MLLDKVKKCYDICMQILQFDTLEELNKFLVEIKEDKNRYVKSIKSKTIEKMVHFVMVEESTYPGQKYEPKHFDSVQR